MKVVRDADEAILNVAVLRSGPTWCNYQPPTTPQPASLSLSKGPSSGPSRQSATRLQVSIGRRPARSSAGRRTCCDTRTGAPTKRQSSTGR